MAARAGVSLVTMHKAVRSLREQGCLEAAPGRGIHITQPVTGQANAERSGPAPSSRTTRDALAESVLARIQDGEWTDRLPTQKELAAYLGTTRKTVGLALNLLRDRGILDVRCRRYSIRRNLVTAKPRTIGLIVNSYPGSDLTRRRRTIVEFIEQLAQKHALGIRYRSFLGSPERTVASVVASLQAGHEGDQGTIYVSSGFRVRRSLALVRSLAMLGGPLLLYSDAEPSPEVKQFADSRLNVLLFTHPYAGATLGYDAGRYLADLGHRSVVYLSDQHEQMWSRNRFKGIQKALSTSSGSCTPIVYDTPRAVAVPPAPRKRREPTTFVERQDRMSAVTSYRWQTRVAQLETLFERAASCAGTTAWVCCNDEVALLAVDYLRTRGIRVPEDISVMGFDNIPEAHNESLTSYRFKDLELAQIMFTHLTNSTLFHAAKRKHEVVMIGGGVVARSTCGPPRTPTR